MFHHYSCHSQSHKPGLATLRPKGVVSIAMATTATATTMTTATTRNSFFEARQLFVLTSTLCLLVVVVVLVMVVLLLVVCPQLHFSFLCAVVGYTDENLGPKRQQSTQKRIVDEENKPSQDPGEKINRSNCLWRTARKRLPIALNPIEKNSVAVDKTPNHVKRTI